MAKANRTVPKGATVRASAPDRALDARLARLLRQLEGGATLQRCAEGWLIGGAALEAADGHVLLARDLVEEVRSTQPRGIAAGRNQIRFYRLSAPGRAWLRRRDAAVEPDYRQNRQIAQRTAMIDGTAQTVEVNLAESPVAWLRRRKFITDAQQQAAERLRCDWEMANLAPRISMRWDLSALTSQRGLPQDHLDPASSQIAARVRFEQALDVAGPGLRDILWRVACAGEGLDAAERSLGWPSRSGKLVLALALDRLVMHYRIK